MRRWHSEVPLMLKRWESEKNKHRNRTFNIIDGNCHCLRGPGAMRKRDPYDCGHARCLLCHGDKFGKGSYSRARGNIERQIIAQELYSTY